MEQDLLKIQIKNLIKENIDSLVKLYSEATIQMLSLPMVNKDKTILLDTIYELRDEALDLMSFTDMITDVLDDSEDPKEPPQQSFWDLFGRN